MSSSQADNGHAKTDARRIVERHTRRIVARGQAVYQLRQSQNENTSKEGYGKG